MSPLDIKFSSNQVLNINLSLSLLDVVKTIIDKSAEKAGLKSEAAHNLDEKKGAIYEITNNLGTDIHFWFEIDKNSESWHLKNHEKMNFSQKYVDRIQSQLEGNSRNGSMVDSIQAPLTISVAVAGMTTAQGISVEKSGMQAFTICNNLNEVTILIRVQQNEKKHEIIIESASRVINNSDFQITLINRDSSQKIPENSTWALPVD